MSKHDDTANRIARQQGTEYNRGQGPDIIKSDKVIEVETARSVDDASRQLAGFRKPAYVAGADAEATAKALEKYKNTTIGVMNQKGKIVRPSTRKRK